MAAFTTARDSARTRIKSARRPTRAHLRTVGCRLAITGLRQGSAITSGFGHTGLSQRGASQPRAALEAGLPTTASPFLTNGPPASFPRRVLHPGGALSPRRGNAGGAAPGTESEQRPHVARSVAACRIARVRRVAGDLFGHSVSPAGRRRRCSGSAKGAIAASLRPHQATGTQRSGHYAGATRRTDQFDRSGSTSAPLRPSIDRSPIRGRLRNLECNP